MKTEQEQIEQIEKVLKDSVADYKHLKKKGVCYCYAETLIDHGYGDVSEYKAEIEQLKAKNKVLGDGVVKAFTNGFNTGREQVEKDIRRAKINILRELKENAVEIYSKEFGQMEFVEVDAIDELIKEVENEN